MNRFLFVLFVILLASRHVSAQTATYSLPLTCNSITHFCTLTPVFTLINAQDVGPSAALYANPYYTCSSTTYVSQAGSDTTGNGTSGNPYATLTKANSVLTNGTGGQCVYVVASGTPYAGVVLTKSGSTAAAGGYITYRCTTLDGCAVNCTTLMNGSADVCFGSFGTNSANYTIVDGFNLTGTGVNNQEGVDFTGSTGGANTAGSHHQWVLNSVITANGVAGIAFANNDYSYSIHNTISGNTIGTNCNTAAQGSGLADNIPEDISYMNPSYVATTDDKTNPNGSYLGIPSFVVGSSWFHKVYAWNYIYNNHEGTCSSGNANSDGNCVILDTFRQSGGNIVDYPDQTLIAYNLAVNCGAVGIHIFNSLGATIANNTAYNGGLDPYTNGGKPTIDTNGSYNNTIFNNIAVSIPLAPVSPSSCNFSGTPVQQYNSAILGGGASTPADSFSTNITQLQGGNNSCYGTTGGSPASGEAPMFNNDVGVYSCTGNKCGTNPLWVSVGGTSSGTQSTLPNGNNFALQSGSPAIGYGSTAGYLPATSVDSGACYHTLSSCP